MKRKWIIFIAVLIAVLWAGVFGVAFFVQHGLNRDHTSAAELAQQTASVDKPPDLKVLWDAPDFSFPDQDGKTVTRADLLGHVWIADFFFSQCTTACPVITSKLMLMQKQMTQPDLRFISFSVDPEHDTPAALKKYANEWAGDQARWKLLSTNQADLQKVALGMKVTVAPSGNEVNPILHSTLFMLVDKQGKVRGIYDSMDPDAIKQLRVDVRTLAGREPPASDEAIQASMTPAERGHIVFGSMGCVACHGRAAIAPPLQNVFGSIVHLDDGRSVWADEAYIHESIVDPQAKTVAGYGKTMPSLKSYLSDAQVMDLVAYIKSLSPAAPGGHGYVTTAPVSKGDEPELLTDPVCKMQVTSDPSAPHADFEGKTYYFCSDNCRKQFLKAPKKFAATQPAK
jgi:protein SCO1/2